MTQYAIITDLNLCVGCLACSVACKVTNGVPAGNYWEKMLRVGPTPTSSGSGQWPDVGMYFLPIQCQHCENPACVEVCPTSASHKTQDGTVQVDKSKCIGCQFCVMACPYGVRYLNEEERVVEKCTLCEQKTAQGELPQCVAQCGGRARYFGDMDKGFDSFVGPDMADESNSQASRSYDKLSAGRIRMLDFVDDFSESDVHHLPNVGNNPSFAYILRNHEWQGEE